jgi:hypothetical protein
MTTAPNQDTITIETSVDPLWVKQCMSNDMFMTSYIGYWAYGTEYDEQLGWLVFEHAAAAFDAPRKTPKTVLAAWQAGEKLPEGWHRLDKETITRAWAEGVKHSGVNWFEDGDANDYDVALQMAILGEVRYD